MSLLALLASVLLNAFLSLALFAVVLHLYYKDYCAAQAGDGIGYEHGPYYVGAVQHSLQHECKGANCHQQECRHRNAACVAGAYGGYCLWQKAEYEACACHIAADGV